MTPDRYIRAAPSVLTLLLVLVLGAGGALGPAQAAPLQAIEGFNILLGRPTDDSITVNVIPDQSGDISFEYGTVSGVYGSHTDAISCTVDEPVEVVIDGLTSNTRYYYRLRFRAAGGDPWTAGGEHSLHTQRAPGSTFTFTVISDSHMNGGGGVVSLYQQTLANVAAENPDFHFDLGDTAWTDGVTTASAANQRYLAQRQYMGTISHSASIFVATGNHENEEGWNLDDTNSIALLSINARKLYCPNPIPDSFYTGNPDVSVTGISGDHLREDYFAWQWGNALFVFIDPYQYTLIKPFAGTAGGEVNDETPIGDRWSWTLGQQQFNWFKETLEDSDATFKFVFAHHMVGGSYDYVRGGAGPAHMFEWGGYNIDGFTWGFDAERPGWGDDPIHQLMIDNGVSAFFHGHDHEYAYEERDGVVYQLVPAPSMTGYGFGLYSEDDPYTIRVLPDPGHLRVTVSPSQATVDYVATSSGEVNYYYTIEAAPEPSILGGVDGDDLVNSTDALIILSCDAGIDTSQFCPMNCGDVNDDGLVNSTDALIILSYDVGMTVPYAVGEAGCPSGVTPCSGCVL